jgi:hypothetical protein
MTDPLLLALFDLPSAAPDRARMDRTRKRCHARLARQRPRPVARRVVPPRVWLPLAAVLAGVYITQVISLALHAYGLL